MEARIKGLCENACLGVLRGNYAGLVKACVASRLASDDVIEYYKQHAPGFDDYVAHLIAERAHVAYPQKWSLKTVHDVDKAAIVKLYHVDNFHESTMTFLDTYEQRHQAMLTLALLCHGKRALPCSADADKHGLWVAFSRCYPTTASTEPKRAAPRARSTMIQLLQDISDKLQVIHDDLERGRLAR